MRYRITLDNNNGYEAVIFMNFKEQEGGKNQSIMQKKLIGVVTVWSSIGDELRGAAAFTLKRIEEVPPD
jgi:hypothetical protein